MAPAETGIITVIIIFTLIIITQVDQGWTVSLTIGVKNKQTKKELTYKEQIQLSLSISSQKASRQASYLHTQMIWPPTCYMTTCTLQTWLREWILSTANLDLEGICHLPSPTTFHF